MNDSASIAWMSIVFISSRSAPRSTSLLEGNRSHLAHQRGIKANFVQSIQYVAGRSRNRVAHNRVDVNDDDVRGLAAINQGEYRGITHVAAVPIGFAIDFDDLEE